MPGIFPTFCHIGDYGPTLYQSLERMIALSDPLILWTPSAIMLDKYKSPVNGHRLLGFVDSGHVKIIGRKPWLTDPSFRKHSSWEGSPWQREFDDSVRTMALKDESLNFESRRVILAPPESGYQKANELLGENKPLYEVIKRSLAKEDLPPGTLRKAIYRTKHTGEHAAVHLVLRDAINHAEAVAFAGARAPYLQPQEGAFIGLMEMAADPHLRHELNSENHNLVDINQDTIVIIDAALQILKSLEPVDRRQHLDRFLKSPGRAELVKFVRRVVDVRARYPGTNLVESLQDRIENGLSSPSILPHNPIEKFMYVANLAISLVSLHHQHITDLAIAGLLTGVYPVGRGLLRKVGVLPPEYNGLQFPFLWHNGADPKPHEVERVLKLLEEVRVQIAYSENQS